MEPHTYDKIQEASAFLQSFLSQSPTYALVLGTGMELGQSAFQPVVEIPYQEIPHFHASGVTSHRGTFISGFWHGQPMVILSGRNHYYEGFSAAEVAFPVQVVASLGCRHIIFTNAAGGVNPHFKEGDIVLVEDHINLIPDNPLRGFHDDRLGLRFPDMMYTYCQETAESFKAVGREIGIYLQSGVYLALPGPSLETPAEYRMAYRLGADMVGMSTVPEVIAARHAGMNVSAFSIISNVCYPQSRLSPTTVEEVIHTVRKSSGHLIKLLDLYFQQYQP